MDYLPLFHKLQGRVVLLVGGGEMALRKARLLLETGATLRVVAPLVSDELQSLLAAKQGQCLLREYQTADMQDCCLVLATTNQPAVNAAIAEQAKAQGIPVYAVGALELSSIIFPAIVDRSPLIVAVSSAGRVEPVYLWHECHDQQLAHSRGQLPAHHSGSSDPQPSSRLGVWHHFRLSRALGGGSGRAGLIH